MLWALRVVINSINEIMPFFLLFKYLFHLTVWNADNNKETGIFLISYDCTRNSLEHKQRSLTRMFINKTCQEI